MAEKSGAKMEKRGKRKRGAKKIIKKQEKQIRRTVIIMVILIMAVVFINFLVQKSKKFEYAGLEFIKIKKGELNLYYTKFPILNPTGSVVGYVPFYFRKDPRKLDDIDIGGNIILKKNVALAIDDNFVKKCGDSVLAATTLSLFLQSTEVEAFGATTNRTEADLLGRRYVRCGDANTLLFNPYSVLEFREGNENSINRINSDCYALTVANCEIMAVTERFMLGMYAHSRGIKI